MQDSIDNMFGSLEEEKSRDYWMKRKGKKMIIPLPLVLTLLKIEKLENIHPFLDVIKIKMGREEIIKYHTN